MSNAVDNQSVNHVTRQFLGRQAQHAKFVPFAEAGPAPNAPPGTMLAHRLYVTAGWQQEIRVSRHIALATFFSPFATRSLLI